jgi:hypothetical protein
MTAAPGWPAAPFPALRAGQPAGPGAVRPRSRRARRLARAALAAAAATSLSLGAGLPAAQAATTPRWRVFHAIPAANSVLDDVTAVSASDAWAGGSTPAQTPVLYHWDGRRWLTVPRPGTAGWFASSVSASAPGNVWAAISNGDAVDHWNGRAWTRTSFGAPSGTLIGGVVTLGPRDTWAFSYNESTQRETAHHFNGRSWRSGPLPASVDGGGEAGLVSASSAADIWAFGSAHGAWVTTHYDGKSWGTVPLPAGLVPAGQELLPERIVAQSRRDAWATLLSVSSAGAGPAVLLHWNGTRWARVTRGIPAAALLGPVASDGQGGLWLSAETPAYAPYLAHYRNGHWTRVTVPAAAQGAVSVASLALIPGTRTLWGAGAVAAGGFGTTKGAAILAYGH